MQKSPSDIDHLSASSIKTFLQCPAGWEFRYLEGMRGRWGSALVKGRAVDAAATATWKQKPETGEDLSIEEAQAIAEHSFYEAVDEAGGKNEIDWGTSNLGAELDSTTRMTRRFMTDLAPLYTPVEVQKHFIVDINRDRYLTGFIDAVTEDTVVDVKTGGRRMSQADADRDLQMSSYAVPTGFRKFAFARVIHSSAKAQTSSELILTERSPKGIEGFLELARDVSDAIDMGVFPRSPGWHCTFCPAANTCPVGTPNL